MVKHIPLSRKITDVQYALLRDHADEKGYEIMILKVGNYASHVAFRKVGLLPVTSGRFTAEWSDPIQTFDDAISWINQAENNRTEDGYKNRRARVQKERKESGMTQFCSQEPVEKPNTYQILVKCYNCTRKHTLDIPFGHEWKNATRGEPAYYCSPDDETDDAVCVFCRNCGSGDLNIQEWVEPDDPDVVKIDADRLQTKDGGPPIAGQPVFYKERRDVDPNIAEKKDVLSLLEDAIDAHKHSLNKYSMKELKKGGYVNASAVSLDGTIMHDIITRIADKDGDFQPITGKKKKVRINKAN